MSKNEEIKNYRKQLYIYRKNLAIYLQQYAIAGIANVQPSIIHGIDESRENIRRIKLTLRSLGIEVKDQPDDENATSSVMVPLAHPQTSAFIFATINIIKGDPYWIPLPPNADSFLFDIVCTKGFQLEAPVQGANIAFDIVVLNLNIDPLIITDVGIEVVSIASQMAWYGQFEAAKIHKTDSYVLEIPDLRSMMSEHQKIKEVSRWIRKLDLNEVYTTTLEDPIYVPSRAPYRYGLLINEYQNRMPKYAVIRMVVQTNLGEERSQAIHLKTW